MEIQPATQKAMAGAMGCLLTGLLLVGGCVYMINGCVDRLGNFKPTAAPMSAQPADEDRLTMKNYHLIKNGMIYKEVVEIIGEMSEEAASAGYSGETMTMLTWKGSWGKSIVITFQNGRVAAKGQFGLPAGSSSSNKTKESASIVIPKSAYDPEKETWQRPKTKHNPGVGRGRIFSEGTFSGSAAGMLGGGPTKPSAPKKPEEKKPEYRKWTDATGSYTTEAEFAGFLDGIVTLKTRDGTIKKVAFKKLSDEDQAWVRKNDPSGILNSPFSPY